MPAPYIVAHRGNTQGPNVADPENTLAAFDRAIQAGIHMIETDIRITQDHIPIIHHDPTFNGQPIHQLDYATIRAASHDDRRSNCHIPTLAEALDYCRDRIDLDLEIKLPGHEQVILTQILQHYPIAQFVITSFEPTVLHRIHQLNPQVTIGLLIKPQLQHQLFPCRLKHTIVQLKPDFLAPHHSLLKAPYLPQINPKSLPYWTWTANDRQLIEQLKQNSQVTHIITDYSNTPQ
jgi:glycerophosphoryl diester phosphodiesterase